MADAERAAPAGAGRDRARASRTELELVAQAAEGVAAALYCRGMRAGAPGAVPSGSTVRATWPAHIGVQAGPFRWLTAVTAPPPSCTGPGRSRDPGSPDHLRLAPRLLFLLLGPFLSLAPDLVLLRIVLRGLRASDARWRRAEVVGGPL